MPRTHTNRAPRAVAAAVAVLAVAALTLAPRSLVWPARGMFTRVFDRLTEPLWWLPAVDMERALNTALFVPVGFVVALLLPPRAWPLAVLAGAALSVGVEIAQSSIPGRVPDGADVLWNTLGTAAGVLVVVSGRLVRGLAARAR